MEQTGEMSHTIKVKLVLIVQTMIELVTYISSQAVKFFTENSKFGTFMHNVSLRVFSNWWHVKPRTINKISISSKQSYQERAPNNTQQFSSTFFAILHQITKHDTMSSKILALNHIRLTDYDYHIDQCSCSDECRLSQEERNGRTERFKRAMMILRQRNPFKMSKSVDCIIR